jgi:F0F1-type ATP synthase membrane subunit a
MIGIIPYAFTVASHIIITATLALLVFFTVLVYAGSSKIFDRLLDSWLTRAVDLGVISLLRRILDRRLRPLVERIAFDAPLFCCGDILRNGFDLTFR